jgi:hypothetical protein
VSAAERNGRHDVLVNRRHVHADAVGDIAEHYIAVEHMNQLQHQPAALTTSGPQLRVEADGSRDLAVTRRDCVGYRGVAAEAHTIRIGDFNQTKTFIAGISGRAVTGAAVVVNAAGQLGTAPSSQRFKDEIKPMDKASEAILALKPVTFHYKKEIDPEGIPQFGLVAEEVEKVNPDLVVCDKEGKPYSVRYDQVNAMLLNEFLKEHRKVQEQEKTIAQLQQDFQSKLAEQQKQIKALASGLERVSAQLEVTKPAPQTVLNNQ